MCPILDNKLNFYSIHSCLPPSVAERLQKGIQWMSRGKQKKCHTQFYRRNRGSETKQPFQVHKASGGQVVLQTGTVKAT